MGAPPKFGGRPKNFGATPWEQKSTEDGVNIISPNSARKIRNAIDWMMAAATDKWLLSRQSNKYYKWKLSFLTLTLPTQGKMTDLEIKSVLNSFLTLAKYNYGLHSYIWKAEPQARGVIHFHLTSDCYMWKNSVRFEWNRLLKAKNLLNNHDDPPSTKIHSVHRVKSMGAYLTKYFIKPRAKENYPPFIPSHLIRTNKDIRFTREEFINATPHNYIRPIQGRQWGCSHSLSKVRNFSYTCGSDEMRTDVHHLRQCSSKETDSTFCNMFLLAHPKNFYGGNSIVSLEYAKNILSVRKTLHRGMYEIYSPEGKIITNQKIIRKLVKPI